MTNQLQSAPTPKKPVHLPSVLMVVAGFTGILVLLVGAGLTFFSGFVSLFDLSTGSLDTAVLFSYTAGALFLCLLLVPSIVLSIRRMSGKPTTAMHTNLGKFARLLHPKGLIWLYPFLLLAGYFLNQSQTVNWLFMPVINVLVLAIPVAWLLWLGSKKFTPSSYQRNWSAFGIGMTLGPVLIFIIEIAAILIGIVLVGTFVMTAFPNIETLLEELVTSLQAAQSPQQIPQETLSELFLNPGVIAILLLFVSGFVPLVEEIIKPVAVWLLWSRPLTTQDGWMLGLLSGAGFALVENLGNVAIGDGWLFVVLARGGASALHMFNTALIGYTFVLARKQKRILPPILALAGTVLIHAIWNGLTIFATIGSVSNPANDTGTVWPLEYVIVLVVISLVILAGILLFNRRLAEEKPNAKTDVEPAKSDLPVEMQPE